MKEPSFVDEMEEIVDIVSDWGVETIMKAIEDLGNRPFDSVELSVEQQLEDYLKLRGNPQAWSTYIDGKATELITQLQADCVPGDDIVSIHPHDIAIKYAIDWSSRMEMEIAKNPQKAGFVK